MDAFIIRGTLVPAFMRLAGEANWWAPGPLRRLHDRYGISEHVVLEDDEPIGPSIDLAAPAFDEAATDGPAREEVDDGAKVGG